MAIGRTPVASGSSVPPWPTFCAWVRRLTTLTTWVEVMPAPLSITSQPLIGRPVALRRPIGVVLLGPGAAVRRAAADPMRAA